MNISNQLRSREKGKSRLAGFSTIELVLVLGIMLIVAGFVIPSAVQTWYAMELRASAAEVSDLMQQARMLAAKKNATYPIRYQLANGVQQAYIDLNNNNALDVGEPNVLLARMTAAAGAPTGGAGQPSPYVLAGDTSTGTPFDNTNTLAFSPRGLPCNYSAPPTCSTPAASYFVYYFQDGRPNGWSAVLVTKAGRSKILMWNGSTWH
jgi:Tfp pilus assembly protein FimT